MKSNLQEIIKITDEQYIDIAIDISKKAKYPYGAIVVKELYREKAVNVLKMRGCKLWESTNQTWSDMETNFVFDLETVMKSSFEQVQKALTKYKVALQQNKQTEIWIKLCNYWLYVLYQYTDIKFNNMEDLTVAPDTHVIQTSHRLGIYKR